ncbi:MAG: PASTA domain-containing protein [Actinobacteria bacterium]|uniref:Unannotated protein n=1 Tax=freshwater metagenome TaxID=449393 RepID=A0A6J6Z359_9ZZZZ|nr:PASTA domain-containing protein [Actinomycetota bacterium]
MASKDDDAATRTLAGRYRLGPTLGTGANAKSFDATDLEDGAPVVVKMLPSRFGASKTFMERFTADLATAAGVLHPNLARIKDFGVETVGDKAYPFVVTEQFVGGSLRGILDRGRTITASQALMVGLDVCRGLAFAHSKSLVHGAVTPSNVLFGPDRKVRLADLGISRLLGDIVWGDPGRIDVDMARYASPEHALGLPVGPKSDVYSLALTLVESVTGQVPFAADTSVATLSARLNKLMSVSADLGALASVLERAGRPVLEDRFTAVEFGRALVGAAEFMPRPEPIAVVGLGRFGDAAASLPESADPTDAHGVNITEAIAAVRADERAPTPPSAQNDSLALLRSLPDAVLDGPPIAMPTVQAVPPAPLSDPPVVTAPVEFERLPAAGSHITDEHGSPDRAPVATVIGEVAADWVPDVEPTRRTSTIETVEGDDDVLNIDRRSMLKYVISALAVLAIAVLGVIGYRALSAPSRTVPNLTGMTEAQAANVVADNGWELEVRRVRDDGQAQGDVVRTDPASGDRLRKGDSLVLVVSDGPTLSALPNVTGLDVDNARSALSAVGLTMREAQQVASETVSLGVVISWSVPEQPGLTAGSQVPKGTTIEVVVSSGSPNRAVPNLNGLTVEEVTARLALAELVLGSTSEEFSTTVGVGRVIASNPAADAGVTVGAAVNVVVSKGPDLVKMPKVVGVTLQVATDALIKAGLQVGSVTGGQDGTVSWSNVSAGDLVVRGTAVALTMLAPPPTTTTTTTVARPN